MKNGTDGTVLVGFVVNKNGNITNIKIGRDIGATAKKSGTNMG
ncbi:MAG TPA: hypothetical protein DGP89_08355 [Saprospirales bacterium]|nr:hypothetical protein [Saprospirales bacterium]